VWSETLLKTYLKLRQCIVRLFLYRYNSERDSLIKESGPNFKPFGKVERNLKKSQKSYAEVPLEDTCLNARPARKSLEERRPATGLSVNPVTPRQDSIISSTKYSCIRGNTEVKRTWQ
jgi:hypothetical protein